MLPIKLLTRKKILKTKKDNKIRKVENRKNQIIQTTTRLIAKSKKKIMKKISGGIQKREKFNK
jgi:hypothetical protein